MYNELSGSRQWTMGGPAEIPYQVKVMWLNENQIFDPSERDEFLTVVRALDGVYLEHAAKKVGKK